MYVISHDCRVNTNTRESCHGISRVVQIYTFPSRVNHYFHDNFLHFTREILRDITRGTSRVCEVIVELYCTSRHCQLSPFLLDRIAVFWSLLTTTYSLSMKKSLFAMSWWLPTEETDQLLACLCVTTSTCQQFSGNLAIIKYINRIKNAETITDTGAR